MRSIWILTIGLILVILAAGCIGSPSSSPATTPAPTPDVPRYRLGDVIAMNDTDSVGLIILDYNKSLDEYSDRPILQKTDGSWAYYSPSYEMMQGKRATIDKNFTNLVGHVSDLSTIKTFDLSNLPNDIAYVVYLHQTNQTSRYTVGDLFYGSPNTFDSETKADYCYVVYAVDLIDRNYTVDVVYRNQGETQWKKHYPSLSTRSMELMDNKYPFLVGHIDISTIKTEYPSQETFDAKYGLGSTLTPMKTPTPIKQSMQFGGAGDDVRGFTIVGGGGYLVYATVSGPMDNFIVHITDERGKTIEYLFNEISPYYGKTIITLDPGKYFLSVEAGGPWSIDLSST